MLRQMRDMPLGTHGFEAIGEVDDDDWARTVEPVLRQEIAEGRTLRLLYVLGPATMDVDDDALKAGAGFRARHVTLVRARRRGQRRRLDTSRVARPVVSSAR